MKNIIALFLSATSCFAGGFLFTSISVAPTVIALNFTNHVGDFAAVFESTNLTYWSLMWRTNTTANPQTVRDKCVTLHDGPTDELLGEYQWVSDVKFTGKIHTDWSIDFSGTNWQVFNVGAPTVVYCESETTNVQGAYHGISGDCTGTVMDNEGHKFYAITDSATKSPYASTNNPYGWWYVNPGSETSGTNSSPPQMMSVRRTRFTKRIIMPPIPGHDGFNDN